MENGQESKIRKVLFNEISLVVAVIAVLIGVFTFITEPDMENDIALQLQDARITSQQKVIDGLTETQQNDIKEVKNEMAGLRTEIQTLTNTITRLDTVIQERIPQLFN